MDPDQLLPKIYETVGKIEATLTTYHERLDHVESEVDKLKTQWAWLRGIAAVLTLPFTILFTIWKRKHE